MTSQETECICDCTGAWLDVTCVEHVKLVTDHLEQMALPGTNMITAVSL